MNDDLTAGPINDPFSMGVAYARWSSSSWRGPIVWSRIWSDPELPFIDALVEWSRGVNA